MKGLSLGMSLLGNAFIQPASATVGAIKAIETFKQNCKGKGIGIAPLCDPQTLDHEFCDFSRQQTIPQQRVKMPSDVDQGVDDKINFTIWVLHLLSYRLELSRNFFSR